jgi:hypothetical protein
MHVYEHVFDCVCMCVCVCVCVVVSVCGGEGMSCLSDSSATVGTGTAPARRSLRSGVNPVRRP